MPMNWIEVIAPAPVLNTPDFRSVFGGESGFDIPRDSFGHPAAYEFVALPGMRFSVVASVDPHILQIAAPTYSSKPLYIDQRFCRPCDGLKTYGEPSFSAAELLEKMEKRLGLPYVWGGNWSEGIPQVLDYYKPAGNLDSRVEELWTFRGLDCSGLLFEATLGKTPRNTSALVLYGRPLANDDLRPMDMIVYPGHVLFVRDRDTIIESKSPFGVRIQPLKKRMDEILVEREFVRNWDLQTDPNRSFTIRRFCSAE